MRFIYKLDKYLKLDELSEFTEIGGRLIVSFIIILVALAAARIIKKMVMKLLLASKRLMGNNSDTVISLISSVSCYAVYFVAVCIVLDLWGIDITSILALGGVASLCLGIGAQDMIKDVLAGVNILTDSHFAVGDYVNIEGFSGKVESIGLRTTCIRSAEGDLYVIPNGKIGIVNNMSKGYNRAVVDVGISYEEDVDRVIAVLNDEMKKVFEKLEGLLAVPAVWGINEFGESAVIIRVVADCEIGENWRIERELRRYIKKRFDKEGIEIPYAKLDVYMKG